MAPPPSRFSPAGNVSGRWTPAESAPIPGAAALRAALRSLREPFFVVDADGVPAVGRGGSAAFGPGAAGTYPVRAYSPACPIEALGDPTFLEDYGVRYAYATGSMANGIASCELVEAVAGAGMLSFFGAAGLPPSRIEAAIDRLQKSLPGRTYGFNLIHSPAEPRLEEEVADLYLRRGVRLVEASAYLGLTPAIVRYRAAGLKRGADGRVVIRNHVIAKVSRVEVARRFLSPAPQAMLKELVAAGKLTAEQAELAARVPMADDLTAEADSGGHTDNRPLVSLLPTLLALRDRVQAEFGYARAPRIGAAGGVSTPASVAAAFAMGAAYVMTGSINQACAESGSSDVVRDMLADAGQADTAMAPAADMFEMGVKVQVLKRGTMFAMRAAKLYDLYKLAASLESIPAADRAMLERDYFRAPLETIWAQTREFFEARDRTQVERADRDPKHKLALVFRWYLGLSSRWANAGEPTRRMDYQVWCGPAMGAFNEWVQGSFLQKRAERRAVVVALNLLAGAAVLSRAGELRRQGLPLSPEVERFEPLPLDELQALLASEEPLTA